MRVHGTGPVASSLASLLAASGVGQVSCTGVAAGPPGRPTCRRATCRRACRRARGRGPRAGALATRGPGPARPPGCDRPPGTRRGTPGRGRRPDLAVLADGYPPELPGTLVAGSVAHLTAAASEAIGVVGPLVVPGRTACLSCVDMARTDRDPAWPLILAQACGRTPRPPACAAVLTAAVAAQAAAQALAFLDRAAAVAAVINGTLELVLPDWQWRRRSWAPHPQCRCSRRPAS